MKKILMITYSFPPAGGSGVQRSLKFAKYLKYFGWQPIILTVKKGKTDFKDKSLLDECDKDLLIYRTPSIVIRNLPEWHQEINLYTYIRLFEQVKNRIYYVIRHIISELCIPDPYIGWIPFAFLKSVEIIRRHKPELIYATGDPFSSFITAYLLKIMFKIPIILDYRDS